MKTHEWIRCLKFKVRICKQNGGFVYNYDLGEFKRIKGLMNSCLACKWTSLFIEKGWREGADQICKITCCGFVGL